MQALQSEIETIQKELANINVELKEKIEWSEKIYGK